MGNGGRRGRWIAIAFALLCSSCATTAAGVVATRANQASGGGDGAITVDPKVRIVTLANGLTAYLRNNDRPGGSAEMRLVINAGSSQEDADQAGTAHFLEHMLFNGTTRFPANELIDTLRGFGMQFGADVNAYTSYDETVYELTVPTTESTNLGAGLDVLREWLSAATLDPQQVDKEKGVVLDEWRQRDQTLGGRISKQADALFLNGSGYEGRQPIGTDAAINAMTPELLRRFYDTWYRPDNAALMVVGDMDVDTMESEIRDRFETLTGRGEAKPRTDPTLPAYTTPKASVYADPDATTGDVDLSLPHATTVVRSATDARQGTLLSLAFDMIATRLNDDISRGTAPFTEASVSNNGFVRRLSAPGISVSGEPGQVQASLEAVTAEFERAHRFGFDDGEFSRAMRTYRSSLQNDFDGSSTTQDGDFISRYVDHFLMSTPIPDADSSYQLYDQIYTDISVTDVGAMFNDFLAHTSPHVMLVIPDSVAAAPTEADVVARLSALSSIDVAPRPPAAAGATELMTAPEPVEETASASLPSDDAFIAPTVLTFANGARVVLNHTDITNNNVYFSATSPGGLSLVADGDVPEALNAVSVVTSSGVGDLDPVAFDTLLASSSIQLYPSINQTSEDFNGSSTTDDLETLFQLVNQYLSTPRFDPAALKSTISSLQSYVDDPNSDPGLAGYVAYATARYGAEPRFGIIPTAADLAALDLPTIEKVWRERFTNASDWVFAISGDFKTDTATDLARRYIGTLTGTGATETYADFQQDPPQGVVTKDVHAGTGNKAGLTIDWSVPGTSPTTDEVDADILTSILNTRLTDHIREALGASYSPSASVSLNNEPDRLIETHMDISGDPATIPQISKIVIDDITKMRTAGPTKSEFEAAVAELTNSYTYFDNQTIGDLLTLAPDSPDLITDFRDRPAKLEAATLASIKSFIDQVLPIDRYIEVRTVPA
jgi:zinc protease